MKKIVVGGLVLIVFVTIGLLVGAALEVALAGVLFTGAIGVVLGIVPLGGPVMRIVAFLIGFVLGWVGFGLQAGVLPQTTASQIIAAVLVIIVVTVIAALSRDKVPFWAMLLGAATMVGAYQTAFLAAPENFLTGSPIAATGALVGVAMGLITAGVMNLLEEEVHDDTPAAPPTPTKSDDSGVLSV